MGKIKTDGAMFGAWVKSPPFFVKVTANGINAPKITITPSTKKRNWILRPAIVSEYFLGWITVAEGMYVDCLPGLLLG